tara:strand:+ start:380 stop:574 length:195 start_codon:yes stop_codon:yes gene_type:complete
LNQNNCWNCALRKKGGKNATEVCMWWEEHKNIPKHIMNKGCKFWRDDNAQRIIEMFDGELIIRR